MQYFTCYRYSTLWWSRYISYRSVLELLKGKWELKYGRKSKNVLGRPLIYARDTDAWPTRQNNSRSIHTHRSGNHTYTQNNISRGGREGARFPN